MGVRLLPGPSSLTSLAKYLYLSHICIYPISCFKILSKYEIKVQHHTWNLLSSFETHLCSYIATTHLTRRHILKKVKRSLLFKKKISILSGRFRRNSILYSVKKCIFTKNRFVRRWKQIWYNLYTNSKWWKNKIYHIICANAVETLNIYLCRNKRNEINFKFETNSLSFWRDIERGWVNHYLPIYFILNKQAKNQSFLCVLDFSSRILSSEIYRFRFG